MIRTIAEVKSSTSNQNHHVILNCSCWQCSCLDFFYRRRPCKHIDAVRTLDRVKPGEMVQKRVKLEKEGIRILKRWRKDHGMPLVKE